MKGLCLCLGSLLLGSTALAATEGDPILAPLAHVSTDAAPGMYCDLSLGLSATNEILGVEYDCHGTKEYKDFYPVDKIKQGAVLYHNDTVNVDVIVVSAPNLDVTKGGPVNFHYLSNYLGGEYKDWGAEIDPQGINWVAYTSPSEGHYPFNNLFAQKRTVFGQVVGIQAIQATWTSN